MVKLENLVSGYRVGAMGCQCREELKHETFPSVRVLCVTHVVPFSQTSVRMPMNECDPFRCNRQHKGTQRCALEWCDAESGRRHMSWRTADVHMHVPMHTLVDAHMRMCTSWQGVALVINETQNVAM